MSFIAKIIDNIRNNRTYKTKDLVKVYTQKVDNISYNDLTDSYSGNYIGDVSVNIAKVVTNKKGKTKKYKLITQNNKIVRKKFLFECENGELIVRYSKPLIGTEKKEISEQLSYTEILELEEELNIQYKTERKEREAIKYIANMGLNY